MRPRRTRSRRSPRSPRPSDKKSEDAGSASPASNETTATPQQQQDEPQPDVTEDPATEAAAPVPPSESKGPLVQLMDMVSNDHNSAMGRVRTITIIVLGVGFLTAAGFTFAAWRGHSGVRGVKPTALAALHAITHLFRH
jgi:hypothetical protein